MAVGSTHLYLHRPYTRKEISLHDDELVETNYQFPSVADDVAPSTRQAFILLVEDNKEISVFIQKELSTSYNVLKAYNGLLGSTDILQKEKLSSWSSVRLMPVMDGALNFVK